MTVAIELNFVCGGATFNSLIYGTLLHHLTNLVQLSLCICLCSLNSEYFLVLHFTDSLIN